MVAARNRAADFAHKFNPSGYDEEAIPALGEQEPQRRRVTALVHPAIDTPATRYGRWWHELMQQVSWHDRSSWQRTFDEHQKMSPVPKRSAAEWTMLRTALEGREASAALLLGTAPVMHSEMPFLWRVDDRTCLEGTVDLALVEPATKNWIVLDWKTNRIQSEEKEDLRRRYRPQMAAYWKAVTEMTRASVSAQIYSTSIGKFIAYETAELEAEWERLKRIPAEELTSAMRIA